MNELLSKQLEQISSLIMGLEGKDADLETLDELGQLLELLSHQVKTSYLYNFPEEQEILKPEINQDAFFYFNQNYQIFRTIGAFESIFGRTTNAFLQEVRSLFTDKNFEVFKAETERLLETGEPRKFYLEIISKNNLSLPVYFLLEKITLGDHLEAVSAGMIFSDKSPSELESYRDILMENIPGLDLYLFDTNFKFVLTGGREKERMGLSNSDFTGKTLFEMFDERITKRLFPFYKNALEGNESEGEIRVNERIYFIHATPIIGLSGKVVGGALISQDITAEKEIEKNLLKAKKEAEESNSAKSIFMANMSHEIRTPLNSIIGFSDLLNKTILTPEQEKYSQLIKQSSEHLLSVVNEILFLFKYGMGKVYIEKISMNIHEVVENVGESLNMKADEKKLNFEYDVNDDVPSVLIGDPFRLKQIIMNLAVNAIKFTDVGKVAIHVSNEKLTSKKAYLKFEVEDTGIGIRKEDIATIFDEFSRLRYKNPKKTKGAGLGLSIVKKLVDLLNGRIEVESVPDKGSRFIVILPFQRPQTDKDELPEMKYDIDTNQLMGKRILYADDDANNIFLGESILKKWKTDYVLAHDGGEALELSRQHKFDIILLDIRMPVLMGTEVAVDIRKDKSNVNHKTKMLAVTANIMESDVLNYLKSGFNGYVLKPFGEEYLYNKICNLLKLKSNNKAIMMEGHENNIQNDGRVFDTSLLLKTTGGNIDFFNKMIDTFIANAMETARNFRELGKEEKWTEIGEQAHKAIPSFSYFGLTQLVNNLTKIENMVLREKNFKSIGKLAKVTSDEIESIIAKAENAKLK